MHRQAALAVRQPFSHSRGRRRSRHGILDEIVDQRLVVGNLLVAVQRPQLLQVLEIHEIAVDHIARTLFGSVWRRPVLVEECKAQSPKVQKGPAFLHFLFLYFEVVALLGRNALLAADRQCRRGFWRLPLAPFLDDCAFFPSRLQDAGPKQPRLLARQPKVVLRLSALHQRPQQLSPRLEQQFAGPALRLQRKGLLVSPDAAMHLVVHRVRVLGDDVARNPYRPPVRRPHPAVIVLVLVVVIHRLPVQQPGVLFEVGLRVLVVPPHQLGHGVIAEDRLRFAVFRDFHILAPDLADLPLAHRHQRIRARAPLVAQVRANHRARVFRLVLASH